uniref:OSIGBa0145B03.1 protein n=1 Tax=Oryza sativa TaxID=4530 RepID=Q01MA2_ORYSA|nr:OSIGBa0145B03.1 [Oryza sativa]
MYMTDLFPDVIPQTTESSPPHQSNSGRNTEYAPGLIPNGGLQPFSKGSSENQLIGCGHISSRPKEKDQIKETQANRRSACPGPTIEQALDEEEIGEDVDQAADEKKRIVVKKKSVGPTLKPAPPPPPPSPVQQSSSDKTPSAAGSHHVEEEVQSTTPAIPLVHEEKAKLDQLSVGLIQSNIDRLEARKIYLIAQLEECNAELDLEKQKLADLPNAVEDQKSRLRSAIKNVADMTKSLKIIPGTDAQDAQAIEEVEQTRQRAVSAIQCYLSQ